MVHLECCDVHYFLVHQKAYIKGSFTPRRYPSLEGISTPGDILTLIGVKYPFILMEEPDLRRI